MNDKRAILITNDGFIKQINVYEFTPTLRIPLGPIGGRLDRSRTTGGNGEIVASYSFRLCSTKGYDLGIYVVE